MLHCFSHVLFFAAPGTLDRQAPLSMGFSRQAYWSGLPFLPLGDLPDPTIEPASLKSPALTGGFFTTSTTWGALLFANVLLNSLFLNLPYFLVLELSLVNRFCLSLIYFLMWLIILHLFSLLFIWIIFYCDLFLLDVIFFSRYFGFYRFQRYNPNY